MIPIPPKLIVYGAGLLVVAIVIGSIYGCGRKAKTDDDSLKVAREVIKTERETLKITHRIDMRTNAEGIQTETQARSADNEIEKIRYMARPYIGGGVVSDEDRGGYIAPDSAARVMQLAREARAAALASAARLQPTDAGTR